MSDEQIGIASIEMSQVQLCLEAYDPSNEVHASADLLAASEAVLRAGFARLARGEPLDFPICHVLGARPMGWDGDMDCARCLDKVTCIAGLHRVGRTRPRMLVGVQLIKSEATRTMRERVPCDVVPAMLNPDELRKKDAAYLRALLRQLGRKAKRGATVAELANLIDDIADGRPCSLENDAPESPERPKNASKKMKRRRIWKVVDAAHGDVLKVAARKYASDTVTCTIRDSELGRKWVVAGVEYASAEASAKAAIAIIAGKDSVPRRVGGHRFWGLRRLAKM